MANKNIELNLNTVKIVERENIFLVILSLLLGIGFDLLFYQKEIGISYPIFIFLLLTVFFTGQRKFIDKFNSKFLLLIPITLLSLTFCLFSNELFLSVNLILLPVLIIYQTCILVSTQKSAFNFQAVYNILFDNKISANFMKPLSAFSIGITQAFSKINTKNESLKKVLIGLLVSLPIILLVVILLASADNVFKDYIARFPKILELINFTNGLLHLIIISFIAFLTAGYFGILFNTANKTENVSINSFFNKDYKQLDSIIISTVLVMINLVYCLFVSIQFSYLFGGEQNTLITGYTYAEYARKGFFELLMVTIINLSILLFSISFTEIKNKLTENLMKILSILLIFNTLIILYSGHFRLSLYEEAYGYTQSRLYAHIFMVFLLMVIIQALAKIMIQKISLIKISMISTLIFYVMINYINIDAIIAQNNISRYFETDKIDLEYLKTLSIDAIPQLIRLRQAKDETFRNSINLFLEDKKNLLNNDNNWQSFNLSKEKAKRILE
jgi:hypothetical protein